MSKRSILVIDDEVIWHKLLKSLLSGMGYTVYSALSGADGLKLAEAHKPDCILLDFYLTDGDAVSVCSALKANNVVKNTPVIIFSSDAMVEVIAYSECKAAGFVLKGPRWLRGLSVALESALPSVFFPQPGE